MFWEPLGVPFWGRFGTLLGSFWIPLGSFWVPLGSFGLLLDPFGLLLEHVGTYWDLLGTLLSVIGSFRSNSNQFFTCFIVLLYLQVRFSDKVDQFPQKKTRFPFLAKTGFKSSDSVRYCRQNRES